MKSYALVAYFCNEIEDKIFEVWKTLDELEISSYGIENKERRPHITFADYDYLKLDEYLNDFELFFETFVEIPVKLSVIGSFIGSRTLFIMDPSNVDLRTNHLEYHDYFNKYPVASNSKYIPKDWIPHCTIASRLADNKMLEAYEFCNNNFEILKGCIDQFALLELTHDETGKVIKDSVLKRVKLKINRLKASEKK